MNGVINVFFLKFKMHDCYIKDTSWVIIKKKVAKYNCQKLAPCSEDIIGNFQQTVKIWKS